MFRTYELNWNEISEISNQHPSPIVECLIFEWIFQGNIIKSLIHEIPTFCHIGNLFYEVRMDFLWFANVWNLKCWSDMRKIVKLNGRRVETLSNNVRNFIESYHHSMHLATIQHSSLPKEKCNNRFSFFCLTYSLFQKITSKMFSYKRTFSFFIFILFFFQKRDENSKKKFQ